jgi:hypothetical protein
MKISGEIHIVNENNIPLTNFTENFLTIIFKFITRSTLNNDSYSPPISFNVLGETIFRGNASVTNGQFTPAYSSGEH